MPTDDSVASPAKNPVEIENSIEDENSAEDENSTESENTVENSELSSETSTDPSAEELETSTESKPDEDEPTSEPDTECSVKKPADVLEPPVESPFSIEISGTMSGNSTNVTVFEDLFDIVYENGHIDIKVKHNDKTAAFDNDDLLKRIADSLTAMISANSDVVSFVSSFFQIRSLLKNLINFFI